MSKFENGRRNSAVYPENAGYDNSVLDISFTEWLKYPYGFEAEKTYGKILSAAQKNEGAGEHMSNEHTRAVCLIREHPSRHLDLRVYR